MKRLPLMTALILLSHVAAAADLMRVYERALQNDPQLREAEATRRAALEAKPQALAALLPQLAGKGLISRERDTGPTNTTETVSIPPCAGAPAPAGDIPCAHAGTSSTLVESIPFDGTTDTTTRHYSVDLKQSIFRWENWVALKRADFQVAQAEADYGAAQQDLMQRVAQRFFDVLAARDDLQAQNTALLSADQQLAQAESRYELGLIPVTDVEESRAGRDSAAATVIAAKRTLASAKELLRETTGDAFDTLAHPIEPFELADPDPLSEDLWVDMALQQNLSLISSRLAADIASENVSTARGSFYPSLELVGSVGKLSTDGISEFTNGTPAGGTGLNQTQRSIGIQLTFPLYSGGMAASQVRQAVYQHRAAKERLERVARQTDHDARDAYLGVLSEISRVKALRRAVESTLIALRATESGYAAGTRTALDVLQSRRQWVQAQTDYSHSRYDYLLNVIKLQRAAGILSDSSLARINGLLAEVPRGGKED